MKKLSVDFDEYLAGKLKSPEYRQAFARHRATLRLGEEISRRRKEAGLTLEELAQRAGMLKQNVVRIERPDYSGYTLTTLQRIAQALDAALEVRFVARKPVPSQRRHRQAKTALAHGR